MIYEIRLKGRAERTIAAAFDDLDVSTTDRDTILRGDIRDQAALFGVLDRIQRLGLDLLELRCPDPPA
jgi:hypothetical protein